jgi:hypothetical protein
MYNELCGARDRVVCWGGMLRAGSARVPIPMKSLDFFQFTWSFQLHYDPGFYYDQEFSLGGGGELKRGRRQPRRQLWTEFLENVGSTTSHKSTYRPHISYMDSFTFHTKLCGILQHNRHACFMTVYN